MEQLNPARPRLTIKRAEVPSGVDRTRRIIVAGLLMTTAVVLLQAISQLIDFAVLDLRIRGLNSDTHHSLFGVASLLAQMAVGGVSVWRGYREQRRWRAWSGLGLLVGGLVIVRGLTTFNAKTLAIPLACVFGLVCWLTWRDRGAARAVVWAGLVLMGASLMLHQIGLAADASGGSEYSWAYQITGMIKHGAELAGWMLLATGIVGCVQRPARKPIPDGSLLLEMESVAR